MTRVRRHAVLFLSALLLLLFALPVGAETSYVPNVTASEGSGAVHAESFHMVTDGVNNNSYRIVFDTDHPSDPIVSITRTRSDTDETVSVYAGDGILYKAVTMTGVATRGWSTDHWQVRTKNGAYRDFSVTVTRASDGSAEVKYTVPGNQFYAGKIRNVTKGGGWIVLTAPAAIPTYWGNTAFPSDRAKAAMNGIVSAYAGELNYSPGDTVRFEYYPVQGGYKNLDGDDSTDPETPGSPDAWLPAPYAFCVPAEYVSAWETVGKTYGEDFATIAELKALYGFRIADSNIYLQYEWGMGSGESAEPAAGFSVSVTVRLFRDGVLSGSAETVKVLPAAGTVTAYVSSVPGYEALWSGTGLAFDRWTARKGSGGTETGTDRGNGTYTASFSAADSLTVDWHWKTVSSQDLTDYTVTVRVRDSYGDYLKADSIRLLRGAAVVREVSDTSRLSVTRSDTPALTAGTYSVRAARSGWTMDRTVAEPADSSLSPASPDLTVTVYMRPLIPRSVRVTVRDAETGNPLPDAEVVLSGGSYAVYPRGCVNGSVLLTAKTGADGAAELTEPGRNTYFWATASLDGYEPADEPYFSSHGDAQHYLTHSLQQTGAAEISVYLKRIETPPQKLTLTLRTVDFWSGSSAGTLFHPETKTGLSADYVLSDGTRTWRGRTAADGTVRIPDLEPGTYSLAVSREESAAAVAAGYGAWSEAGLLCGSSERLSTAVSSASFVLGPDRNVLVAHLAATKVRVLVTDPDGSPISGAQVSGAPFAGTLTTGPDGLCPGEPVLLGSFSGRLSVSASGWRTAETLLSFSNLTDAELLLTVVLNRADADADLSVRILPVSGYPGTDRIYAGDVILVSAELTNPGGYDFTPPDGPGSPVRWRFEAYAGDGASPFFVREGNVICRARDTNLFWSELPVPETPGEIGCRVTVSPPEGYADPDLSDNVSERILRSVAVPERRATDYGYSLAVPEGFSPAGIPAQPEAAARSWSVQEWDGDAHAFRPEKTVYTAELSITTTLSPDETARWTAVEDGIDVTRSGYGLNATVLLSLSGNGAGDALFAGARVWALFPEGNYRDRTDSSDWLEKTASSGDGVSFEFPVPAETVSGHRMHFTPLWFPDGSYAVPFQSCGVWTPAGELYGSAAASVRIRGSIYDDWYSGRE